MRGAARWFQVAALVAVMVAGCQEDSTNPATDVPTTKDTAVSGACQHAADCSDGNPCTVDSCTSGKCVHSPLDCDDQNDCTTPEAGAHWIMVCDVETVGGGVWAWRASGANTARANKARRRMVVFMVGSGC